MPDQTTENKLLKKIPVLLTGVFFFISIIPIYFVTVKLSPVILEVIEALGEVRLINQVQDNLGAVERYEKQMILNRNKDHLLEWKEHLDKAIEIDLSSVVEILRAKEPIFRRLLKLQEKLYNPIKGELVELKLIEDRIFNLAGRNKARNQALLKLTRLSQSLLLEEETALLEFRKWIQENKNRFSKKEWGLFNEFERKFIIISDITTENYLLNIKNNRFNSQLKAIMTNRFFVLRDENFARLKLLEKMITGAKVTMGLCFIILFGISLFLFIYISKKNRKVNKILEETIKLKNQLVAQEKLAGLGSLAAGIAHEIKNPLNVIVNASEVCLNKIPKILVEDEKSGKYLGKVKESNELINRYGRRADQIVKNMLKLSRGGDREWSEDDLGRIVYENFQLSYHSMRTKEPIDVECDIKEYSNLPINCIVTDLSQVFVNIFDNSFYALRKKLRDTNFSPKLSLDIRLEATIYVITVEDNGIGIPDNVKDKILEPFFTTKPPGEGTGLGMNFVSDVIMAHKGRIQIDSVENEYTKIIIYLPSR